MGMVDSFRDWANRNSAVATIAAVAVLVVALVILVSSGSGGPSASGDAYFYDVETGETFVGDATAIPPIQSPDGNEAVRAHFYTCTECTEEARFLGYYEKYTAEAKKAIEEAQQSSSSSDPEQSSEAEMQAYEASMSGMLYSKDGENWQQSQGPGGAGPQQELQDKCGDGQRLKYCAP